MDTPFAKDAFADKVLYEIVVEHRRKFYHAGYADYDKDYPQHINFIAPSSVLSEVRTDYAELVCIFVYGNHHDFDMQLHRMEEYSKDLELPSKHTRIGQTHVPRLCTLRNCD